MTRLIVRCPAKINRYLRIGDLDECGYHPLDTEFQAISLFDDLIITLNQSGFIADGPEADGLPIERDNTVFKALRLMREVATLPEIGLCLVKRIPSQAGLGGGSSDAAGLIRGLRHLLPPIYPQRDFDMVAKGVGADVPFFLVGGRAHGTGYGEKLTSLPDTETEHLVIALPGARCSTPEMYKRLDTFRANGLAQINHRALAENSFHDVAPKECLEALGQLQEQGLTHCALTGSGAAVFGSARSKVHAESAAETLAATGLRVWPTQTLTRAESMAIQIED